MNLLFHVVTVLIVFAVALLFFPWRTQPAQQRSRAAAAVAFGAAFGLDALGSYLTNERWWDVLGCVLLAVMFPVEGVRRARKIK